MFLTLYGEYDDQGKTNQPVEWQDFGKRLYAEDFGTKECICSISVALSVASLYISVAFSVASLFTVGVSEIELILTNLAVMWRLLYHILQMKAAGLKSSVYSTNI